MRIEKSENLRIYETKNIKGFGDARSDDIFQIEFKSRQQHSCPLEHGLNRVLRS